MENWNFIWHLIIINFKTCYENLIKTSSVFDRFPVLNLSPAKFVRHFLTNDTFAFLISIFKIFLIFLLSDGESKKSHLGRKWVFICRRADVIWTTQAHQCLVLTVIRKQLFTFYAVPCTSMHIRSVSTMPHLYTHKTIIQQTTCARIRQGAFIK